MSYRVLHLTSPNMEGADVKRVQARLNEATEVPVSLLADGVYGKATGSAVKEWKYRMGFPRKTVNTGMGVLAQQIMFRGRKKLPPAYAARRLKRMKTGWLPGWGVPKVTEAIGPRALAWGEEFVGLTEQPPGSNKVPRLIKAMLAMKVPNWTAQMGYPWCAAYFFACSLAVGSRAAKAGLIDRKFNALFTPAIMAEALAGRSHLMVVGRSQVQPGDGALFDFGGSNGDVVDHIGRVRKVSGSIVTLEGNTSFGPSGSQADGGAVAIRTDRNINTIKMFFREIA